MNAQGNKYLHRATTIRDHTASLLKTNIANISLGRVTAERVAYLTVTQPLLEKLSIKLVVLDKMIEYLQNEFNHEMTDEEAIQTADTCWHLAMDAGARETSGFTKHFLEISCLGPEIYWPNSTNSG